MALSSPVVDSVPEPRAGVDPALARHVGDASRPRRTPPAPDLRHLPGEANVLRGVAAFGDYVKRGVDAHSDRARRFGPVYKVPLPGLTIVFVCDVEASARIVRNTEGAWSAALGWLTYLNGIDTASDVTPGAIDF